MWLTLEHNDDYSATERKQNGFLLNGFILKRSRIGFFMWEVEFGCLVMPRHCSTPIPTLRLKAQTPAESLPGAAAQLCPQLLLAAFPVPSPPGAEAASGTELGARGEP